MDRRVSGIVMVVFLVVACSLPVGQAAPTSTRSADLERVATTLREIESHAEGMVKTADLGAVADKSTARKDYAALVTIAAAELGWLATADVPEALRAPYKTLLSNIYLNAGRLTDGSQDGYFVFLGSKLAPLWLQDLAKVRAVVPGSTG